MNTYIKKVNNLFLRLKKDNVAEYAAECAFFMILSFMPFCMLLLTLVKFANVDQNSLYHYLSLVVPVNMKDYIISILEEIYSKSYTTVSITALIALWSASRGVYSLCKGLRTIYKSRARKANTITRLEGLIYTLLLIIGVILFLILMVFGKRIYKAYLAEFVTFSSVISLLLRLRGLFLIIMIFILFSLMYKLFVPRKQLPIKAQLYGAAFSAIAWFVLSWIFSIYINIFSGFTNTYGSLTTMVLIMMWVYACMYSVLLGAEINVFLYNKNKQNGKNNSKNTEK